MDSADFLIEVELENKFKMEYEVFFNVNNKDYGNGTYMYLKPTDNSESKNDYLIDLRYESIESYEKSALEFFFSHWSGKKGSVPIAMLKITRLKESGSIE